MLALLGPVLAHLDEQEEVNAAAEHLFQVGAGQFADLLDGGAALAQHDGFLAVALDEDDLVDLHRAVLALLPLLGFHRGGVGQFVMQAQIDFLARHFGGQQAGGNVGGFVFGIVPGPIGHSGLDPGRDLLQSLAFQGGNQEDILEQALGMEFSTSGKRSVRFMPSILFNTSAVFFGVPSFRPARIAMVSRAAWELASTVGSAASTTSKMASASCAPLQAAPTMARSRRRRGRKIPGVSTKTIWVSPRITMPRTFIRVVWTLGLTMATLVPTRALTRVDLPALGAPITAAKPQRLISALPGPATRQQP